MAFQSSFTGNQIETCVGTYQNATQVQTAITTAVETAIASAKLAMYPIGSVYISTTNTDPSTFIGGTWTQIQDTFLLACGSTYTAGDTGGEATHTLTVEESPAHTHDRGTMEITGTIVHNNSYSGAFSSAGHTGAFYSVPFSGTNYYLTGRSSGSGWNDVGFKASDAWTGETSSVGGGLAHNNMPPYLAVYVWKRTA